MDVDRVMASEPAFYRDMVRQDSVGPTNVSLIVECGGCARITAADLFWRGAAAIAAVDLLESAGYSVEVWTWFFSAKAIQGTKYRDVFLACLLKECGQVVDTDALACGMSGWFFRIASLGNYFNCPGRPRPASNLGRPVHRMGGWRKYLDVSEGMRVLDLPAAYDRDAAVQAARKMLCDVRTPQAFV